MLTNITNLLFILPGIFLGVILHEFAHGLVSYKLGDPTPKKDGRLSLNPKNHFDLMGTISLLLLGIGWAKPVKVNPYYYKNEKVGVALVALAGPLMNLLISFVIIFINTILIRFLPSSNVMIVLNTILSSTALINISLALFNLIPIPPLDGSKILAAFLPNKIYYKFLSFQRYGMILIYILLFTNVIGGWLFLFRDGIFNLFETISKFILFIK